MPISTMLRTLAALVILDVFGVYTFCLRTTGAYPPSHPWSGITLILLSVGLILGHNSNWAESASWVGATLIGLSAGLWTVAAILRS